MQQKIEEIRKYAKSVLSEKRFVHTVNVAEEAKRLARIWGADCEAAYLAGMAHDIAKEIPFDDVFTMLEGYGYVMDACEEESPAILHAPLGAYILEDKFEIKNCEILNAIRYHTTGRCDMTLLEKIIYIADFTEPGRKYPQAKMVREISEENLEKAVLVQADEVIKFVIERGNTLHNSTVKMRNYYLTKIKRG